jgi:hypothetical protein
MVSGHGGDAEVAWLYPLPPARATGSHAEAVAVAPHGVQIKALPDGVPPKSRKPTISERPFTSGEGSVKVEASSVGLRGAELRTIQQARIVVGATVLVIGVSATVFVIGALTGAGIAAWMMPPV